MAVSACSRAPTGGWSPNVIERLIQQAIVQVLTPIFDPTFSESSFGFRPKRSAHGAAKQVQRTIRRGYRFAVDMDLSRCFEFLGFAFRKSRATINVAPKSIQRFKHRIREITGRSRGISMDRRLSELRSYLRGWMGYYGLASQLKLFDRLDQWLRRRIRMCYWKQWRRPRKRRRELIRLGVPIRQSIRHARSRKGYWHMSKTIASGVGLTNAWLVEQGLLSIKTLWAELAPLRRTA